MKKVKDNTNKCTTWGGVLLNRKGIIPVFVVILTILTILISMGYSALNQNLSVSGEAFLRSKGNVRISRIEMSNAENDGYETYNPEYSKKGTKTYSTLSNKNSTITYTVQITNTTGAKYTVYSMEISNTNSSVSCTPNITKGSIIEAGISDFTIDVKYNGTDDLTENIEDVCEIKYEFIPLDTTPPVLTAEIISQENKTARLKITATDEDGGSGLSPDNIYKYCLSTSSTTASDCIWTNYTSGEEFEINANSLGEYYLLVYSIGDKAGNISDEKENIGEIVNKLYVPLFNKVQDFEYTGSEQTYIVPADGYYKIEAWGAQGGNVVTYSGGKGAYTSGYIYLNKNEKLYVYVGSHPEGLQIAGGYNGGGSITSGQQGYGNGGGGATDIRLTGGEWDNDTGLNSRIMVAAGGGSGNKRGEGYGEGAGGAGGTIYGDNGYSFNATNGFGHGICKGATQISAGIYNFTAGTGGSGGTYVSGAFGKGGGTAVTTELIQSGGGGGYYGGSHCGHGGAGGGSSFISGYAGVNAITSASDRTHTNNTLHYSGKYFIDSNMEEDTNEGNGKAKITYISKEKPERKNKKLNGVRYIQDCTNGNSINVGSHWVELQAIYQGENVAKGKTITAVSNVGTSYGTGTITSIVDGDIDYSQYSEFGESRQCITVDLGQTYDLDEITTWRYWIDNRTYYEHTTFVSSDNVNWTSVTQPTIEESNNGDRISAYEEETKVSAYAIVNLLPDSSFELNQYNLSTSTKTNLTEGISVSTDFARNGWKSLMNYHGQYISFSSGNIDISATPNDIYYVSDWLYNVTLGQYDDNTKGISYIDLSFNYDSTDHWSPDDGGYKFSDGRLNSWHKVSIRRMAPSVNSKIVLSIGPTTSLNKQQYFYSDSVVLLDLTKMFGSGNEPDIEWCNNNIPHTEGVNVIYLTKYNDYYTSIVNANGGYRVNDGTYNLTMINAKNGDTQVITERRRNGYTLNGYTLTNVLTDSATDLGGASITFDPTTKQALYTQGTESVFITANWQANNYTLTVNPNGGILNGTTSTLTYNIDCGNTQNISNPTRTGYVFAGWTISGAGSIVNETTFTMGYENTTLTANWRPATYTLTVKPNGGVLNGTTNNSIFNIAYGSTETILNPTRTGYIFAGWTLSGAGSSISGTTFTMGYENATLTANWTSSKPTYTYTGSSQLIDDGNGNWRIKFLTSGTLTFTSYGNATNGIDIFLVGGGGGGHAGAAGDYEGSGGGGGYTKTVRNYGVTTNVYNITVGAGGTPGSGDGASGSGGASYFGSIGVSGGSGGSNYHYNAASDKGGSGGSGGGVWYGNGGSDGGSGTRGSATTYGTPGSGQGSTTREFEESTGTLYAGGGAGGLHSTVGVNGGSGGGGGTNAAGTANTGGGGGGGNSSTNSPGGYGGTGIVIIRNHRGTEQTGLPTYTYTGSSQLIDDGNGNWRIKFLTSGTLVINNILNISNGVDVFLVGGGAGGAGLGAGGGGGYTQTVRKVSVALNSGYAIVIGAGGNANENGGSSSAFGYSVSGGKTGYFDGGAGGSGGGSGFRKQELASAGAGGSDGSNGGNGYYNGGTGQGTTTREFGEASGKLYAGGGGGGGNNYGPASVCYSGGAGGAGGGGAGGRMGSEGSAGETNTGGGGGGTSAGQFAGGSGIVIIRNAR